MLDGKQRSVVNVEDLVSDSHQYRKLLTLLNFDIFDDVLKEVQYSKTRRGVNGNAIMYQ